jgi:GNAT superfamily N-acetyltransferase
MKIPTSFTTGVICGNNNVAQGLGVGDYTMSISFEKVTEENFLDYEKHFLNAESVFPSEIRSDSEDFRFMLQKQFDPVALAMRIEGEFAGFAIGSSIGHDEVSEYGFPLDLAGKKIIYFFDITLLPKYQGNGVGKRLFCEFLLSAKDTGYDVVLGHYRPGSSEALIKKLGGIQVAVEKNWEETDEDYAACVLSLAHISKESLALSRSELVSQAVLPTAETSAVGVHSA